MHGMPEGNAARHLAQQLQQDSGPWIEYSPPTARSIGKVSCSATGWHQHQRRGHGSGARARAIDRHPEPSRPQHHQGGAL